MVVKLSLKERTAIFARLIELVLRKYFFLVGAIDLDTPRYVEIVLDSDRVPEEEVNVLLLLVMLTSSKSGEI